MQTRYRAEKGKPEVKPIAMQNEKTEFRQRDPLVEDGTTKGDVIFIGSLFVTGLFLKTENAKSQKSEISVTPKDEASHPTIKSTLSSPLFGAAMVVVAIGMYCKYRLLEKYDSMKAE